MEPLTWSGALGPILNPIMLAAHRRLRARLRHELHPDLVGVRAGEVQINPDHTLTIDRTPVDYALMAMKYAALLFVACCAGFIVGGMVMPTLEAKGIIGGMASRLTPVWISPRRRLRRVDLLQAQARPLRQALRQPHRHGGLRAGDVLDLRGGLRGHRRDPWSHRRHQPDAQRGAGHAAPLAGGGSVPYYLLGGDNLGRDVFSRMIFGAQEVLKITPAATLFAFMVGVTLGLPAGYFGGKLDTAITFIANLALAFPVILLFFLLVTPEIVAAGVPQYMSMVLFIFPILFFVVLFNSRYHTQPPKRNLLVAARWSSASWPISR
jgi:peptide/nickel transport system permease protein